MALQSIDHPELNHVYLVRRKVGGGVAARFQPAKVLERTLVTSQAITHYATKVEWVYDNTVETIMEFDGSIKELSQKWLRDEYARRTEEAREAAKIEATLRYMLFTEPYLEAAGLKK